MTAWYTFKKARGRSRDSSPDISPPPSGYPAPDSHTWWWGGGIMTLFCPEGYVPVQVAIARAAQSWFPEQMTALETERAGDNKPSDDVNALTPVGLRQQVLDLLTKTEHRLRNFLHHGALTAYYFGGLFDQGRNAVAPEF
jgi:hypothetical protein